MLVFDIGGGSTQISLARVTDNGKTFIEGFVSLPYGVVTISEAFAGHEMSTLEYSTVVERTQAILQEFEDKHHIREAIANQEIQVIGTSGTVTVIGAVHLNCRVTTVRRWTGLRFRRRILTLPSTKSKPWGRRGAANTRASGSPNPT